MSAAPAIAPEPVFEVLDVDIQYGPTGLLNLLNRAYDEAEKRGAKLCFYNASQVETRLITWSDTPGVLYVSVEGLGS